MLVNEPCEKTSSPSSSIRFVSRGIGLESRLLCFVCGSADDSHLNNIYGFIQSQQDGQKASHWVRARVDFRDYEPNWIQLKIGACDAHLENLRALNTLTRVSDTLTPEMVTQAVAAQ